MHWGVRSIDAVARAFPTTSPLEERGSLRRSLRTETRVINSSRPGSSRTWTALRKRARDKIFASAPTQFEVLNRINAPPHICEHGVKIGAPEVVHPSHSSSILGSSVPKCSVAKDGRVTRSLALRSVSSGQWRYSKTPSSVMQSASTFGNSPAFRSATRHPSHPDTISAGM